MTETPQLRYSKKYKAYFLLMKDSSHSGIAKTAGFGFHKTVKHWFTYDPSKAASLSDYADEKTLSRLKEISTTIKLSRATGHEDFCQDIILKTPADGCEYKPYQKVGVHFITNRAISLVADEQGLGKTVEAIGAFLELQPKHALVICPSSVKYNWQREFIRWSPADIKTHVQQGRKGYPLNRARVTIVNYDVLDALYEELTDKPWDMVIIDEAQYLKNSKAKRTQAALGYRTKKGIVYGAKNVVLLTGTPVPNRPIEFWPVLARLAPEAITPFTKYFDFGRRFCNGYQGPFGWDMSGSSHEDELNRRLRSSIMIRRLKADVLTDLPDKIYQVISFDPDATAKRLIKRENEIADLEDMKKTGKPKGLQVGEIAELRHELAKTKIPMAVAHIKDLLDNAKKVVIFAYHRAVIDALMDALKEFMPVKIDGDITAVQRQRNVDIFQNNIDCRVLVGQINAAGVGITLTAAHNVVFVECTWVPGDIAQAVDRCHRYGQKNSVLAQFLVIRGSLEEYMLRTIVEKQSNINQIVN